MSKIKLIITNKPKNKFLVCVKNAFAHTFSAFSRALYPNNIKCLCCGKDLKTKQDIEICDVCLKMLTFIPETSCCKKCGSFITGSGDYCFNCMDNKREFDAGRSVVVFKDLAQGLVHSFKFGAKPYIKNTLGNLMTNKLLSLGWKFDVIVPVPVSKKRLKQRGYNQAYLLGEVISKNLDVPVLNDVLIKAKETLDQVGLNFNDRQENLKGSIKVNNSQHLKDKTVLLVDDVITTGATSSICAKALKQAGAKCVYVISFANVQDKIHTEKNAETKQKNKK